MSHPEKSCKKPCATFSPYRLASAAVIVSRITLVNMAIGTAEKNKTHFFHLDKLIIKVKAALSAKRDVNDRSPEQASATSNVVLARWRIFPSLNILIPIASTI